jgi:hypothetical protein
VFRVTNNPVLAPFANEQRRCKKYSWVVMVPGTTQTPAFIMLGIGTTGKIIFCGRSRGSVTTSVSPPKSRWCSRAGNQRADLEVLNIRVAQQTDLLVEVTLRHDFIGTGQDGGIRHGKLRNPDNPDHILESAAVEKIRKYSDTYRRNRHVAFLPACMSTSGQGRIHDEFLRLLFFLANKKADDYFESLGYQPYK